jgi:hypothetical protein
MTVNGEEWHKNLDKTLTQKKVGCVLNAIVLK